MKSRQNEHCHVNRPHVHSTAIELNESNRRFEIHKRRQLFIGAHNITLSVAAMRVNNKDRLPVGIDR